LKIVFLALQGRIKKWAIMGGGWDMIIGQLSIYPGGRKEACL